MPALHSHTSGHSFTCLQGPQKPFNPSVMQEKLHNLNQPVWQMHTVLMGLSPLCCMPNSVMLAPCCLQAIVHDQAYGCCASTLATQCLHSQGAEQLLSKFQQNSADNISLSAGRADSA